MNRSVQSPLAAMLPKLERWARLDQSDRDAILDLPHRFLTLAAGQYVVREGDIARSSCLLVSGFAFRSKLVGDGGRQIIAIQMAGDLVDLQNSILGCADHNVQALTRIEVALIPREAVLALTEARPRVARALWHDTLVDGSIHREWTVNIGRRDARTRLAHLLCEFALRVEATGVGDHSNYELPMTQEHLADCLGLTPVHVNRTLKALSEEGLISRKLRSVRIQDWNRLATAGDFSNTYLHMSLDGRSIDPPARAELSA